MRYILICKKQFTFLYVFIYKIYCAVLIPNDKGNSHRCLLHDFFTVAALTVTTVDIGMLFSGELFGAVVAVLRGVDTGGNLSVFQYCQSVHE